MSTEVMLTWRELARQRLRWKRGAFEDLLSFGFTRKTLKGWGLQAVVHPRRSWPPWPTSARCWPRRGSAFTRVSSSPWITVVYAAERLVTVRSRGWKVALGSATVIVEWGYDLYLQVVQVRALGAWCGAPRRPGDIRANKNAPEIQKTENERKEENDVRQGYRRGSAHHRTGRPFRGRTELPVRRP